MIVNSINKTAACKSIYVTSFSDVKNNIQTDISFSGIKVKNLPLSVCLLGALTLTTCELPKWNWTENVRVLASNSQNVAGSYISSTFDLSYLGKLINKLKKKGINTIEQANDSLSKDGYFINEDKYIPLETPGKRLNIFNKKDSNKNRFILTITQDDVEDSSEFKFFLNNFSEKLQKIYNIPKNNIINESTVSKENLIRGIDLVLNKMNKIKDKSNVEFLIIYFGHGMTADIEPLIPKLYKLREKSNLSESDVEHYVCEMLKPSFGKPEGYREGIMLQDSNFQSSKIKGLKETEVKQIFKEKISGIKTLFILDTCYSGAWIADNAKQSAKGKLKETNYINQVRSKAWKVTSKGFARINRFA